MSNPPLNGIALGQFQSPKGYDQYPPCAHYPQLVAPLRGILCLEPLLHFNLENSSFPSWRGKMIV